MVPLEHEHGGVGRLQRADGECVSRVVARALCEDAKLREAWHSETVTLDTAAIPSKEERYGNRDAFFRRPETEMAAIDFHRFWSDVVADTIAVFRGR